jgi:hypothetical protein
MITSISRLFRFGPCLLITLALCVWARPAHAAGAQALLARAIQDTNTVKTLQYTNQFVQTFSNGTVITAVQGQEDEARNRERDHETMITRGKTKQGKLVTRAYVVNVVFLNGRAYYQHPLKDKIWHSQKGMVFKDGVASFKRGRTTVDFNGGRFTPAGTAANGDAHFHASVRKQGVSGSIDVLVSKGKTPYVVLVNERLTQSVKGKTVKLQARFAYGPFNQPLNITAPVSSAV